MKHFRFIFLLTLFFSLRVSFGQTAITDFELKWDKAQQPFKTGYINDLKIIDSNNEYILYYLNTNKYAVIGTNITELRFLVQQNRSTGDYNYIEITPQSQNKKLSYLASDTINNVFHVISYFNNKTQKKLYIFDQTFDKIKLISNNDIHSIAEIDLKDKGSLLENTDFFSNNGGNLHLAFNNGRYLLRYNCQSLKGIKYCFEVFSKSLHHEWGTECMNLNEKEFNSEVSYTIDNDGNVYAIQEMKNYISQKLWLVFYPKDGSKSLSLPVALENNLYFTAKQIAVNRENNLICAGFYSTHESDGATGAFSYIIEPKLAKVKAIQKQEFSQDLIKKGYDFKLQNEYIKKEVVKKEFNKKFNYNLNEIYFRNDGGFDLVAEKYFSERFVSGYQNGAQNSNYNYYFDDLWVLCFYPDGSFKWIQKIPKYEYVVDKSDPIGGYYFYHDKNENLNFIYNNAYSKDAILPRLRNFSTTVSTRLDKDGNETFRELIHENEISKIIVPNYIFKERNDKVILTQFNPINSLMMEKKYNNVIFGELIYK